MEWIGWAFAAVAAVLLTVFIFLDLHQKQQAQHQHKKDQKAQAKLQTEMSRMQKELYHERDIIGLIQEHMVEGILILDDSDKIQLANRTATALLSIEKENWDNKSIFILTDNQAFLDALRKSKTEPQHDMPPADDDLHKGCTEIEEHPEMLNTPVDLAAAAGNALQILEPQIQRNRIQVHLEGRCLLLHSNEGYMRELFINLIDNAIKYNNPGGTVSITIEHVGTQAKIVIADNGIGIPLQAQSRIFERFYRVDKSRSKQRGGTGLGLSIVKHIVDCHNGTISLRSELGHGTEITLLLPEK